MTDDSSENKGYKLVIAPGAFDDFEGTQEELDQMLAEIEKMAESGELLEQSTPLDLEQTFLDDPETGFKIAQALGLLDDLVDEDGNEVTYEMVQAELKAERQRRMN